MDRIAGDHCKLKLNSESKSARRHGRFWFPLQHLHNLHLSRRLSLNLDQMDLNRIVSGFLRDWSRSKITHREVCVATHSIQRKLKLRTVKYRSGMGTISVCSLEALPNSAFLFKFTPTTNSPFKKLPSNKWSRNCDRNMTRLYGNPNTWQSTR